MTNQRISNHGLVEPDAEIFAFERVQTAEDARAAQIVVSNAEPVSRIAPTKTAPIVAAAQVIAKQAGSGTATSNAQETAHVSHEVRSPPKQTLGRAILAQIVTVKNKPRVTVSEPVKVTTPKSPEQAVQVLPNEVLPSQDLPNQELPNQELPDAEGSPSSPTAPPPRNLRTAADLAAMIERDLMQLPESPAQGLRITVYGGARSWRAMLTIAPAAGAVRNPQYLRDMTDNFAECLRQQYDLAWE